MTLLSQQMLEPDAFCTVIFYIPSDGVLQIINAAAPIFYWIAEDDARVQIGLRFFASGPHRTGS